MAIGIPRYAQDFRKTNFLYVSVTPWWGCFLVVLLILSMDTSSLKKLLQQVRNGAVTPDEAVARLRHMPFEDLGFAKVDHHRRVRSGMPEVIFGQGKTPAQMAKIFKSLAAQGSNVLATRVTPEHFRAVKKMVRKAEFRELGA